MFSKSVVVLLSLTSICVFIPAGKAATIVVNSELDVISDDGQCTLREAVIASNTDTPSGAMPGECISGAGSDTIMLQSSTYMMTIAGTGEDQALTGDLDLHDSVDIQGAGLELTFIDGNDLDRIFELDVFPDIVVSIRDLTLTDGATTGSGGGVYSEEILELERVAIVSNSAGGSGGGLYSSGDVSLLDSLITENSSGSVGGGLYSTNLGSIVRSVFMTNTSANEGGGVSNSGDMNITDSSFVFNTSRDGGGIDSGFGTTLTVNRSTVASNIASDDGGGLYLTETVTIQNSTVSGNQATDQGGGIYTNGSLDIRNSTLSFNSASEGAAFHNLESVFTGNVIISGTCSGTDLLLSLGGNIESPGDTCGLTQPSDQTAVTTQALNLGVLDDNGGYTLTHAPMLPSAAIDAGVNGTCLPVDQREIERPQDGDGDGNADCDVGSVEVLPTEEVIFTDGFESGDTSAWSSSVP